MEVAKVIIVLLALLLNTIAKASEKYGATRAKYQFNLDALQTLITVESNSVILQSIKLKPSTSSDRKLIVGDFNFDGIEDFSVSGDEGNVAKFSDIYLFSRKSGKFELNMKFSEIPCFSTNSKERTVSGECFHASSCENWVEKNIVRNDNKLELIEKKGVYCDPITGQAYKYTEAYRRGNLVKNSIHETK